MTRWEYKVLSQKNEQDVSVDAYAANETHERALNGLGAEGWELVSALPVINEGWCWAVTYVFKRQVRS